MNTTQRLAEITSEVEALLAERAKCNPLEEAVKVSLRRLRVRPGFQRTTWAIQDSPWIALDMAWDRDDGCPVLVLGWPPGRRKTVAIPATEYTGHERQRWIGDATIRLTQASIDRLAPGLAAVIGRLLSEFPAEMGS